MGCGRPRERTVGQVRAYGTRSPSAPPPPGRRGANALTIGTAGLLGVTAWAGAGPSDFPAAGVAGHDDQHTEAGTRYVA